MQPLEDVSNLRYIIRPPPDIPTSCFDISTFFTTHDPSSSDQFAPTSSMQKIPGALVTLQAPCGSNESTLDETDEQRRRLVNERKRRRMVSNRESARRSRMRKQKHLDELWLQVNNLMGMNRLLVEEINRVIANHDQLLSENSQLRDDKSVLRKILEDLGVDSVGDDHRQG